MAISQSKRKHPESVKQKMRGSGNGMFGVHRYDKENPFYGKRHNEEARRRMRVAACERVLYLQRMANGRLNNVGSKEGAYFRQLEKEKGWDGVYFDKCGCQHYVAHVGYFVDFYDPFLNIVVEYDEPRHYRNGVLREKDVRRMEQIKNHLNCEFWRYDAYRNELWKFENEIDMKGVL